MWSSCKTKSTLKFCSTQMLHMNTVIINKDIVKNQNLAIYFPIKPSVGFFFKSELPVSVAVQSLTLQHFWPANTSR